MTVDVDAYRTAVPEMASFLGVDALDAAMLKLAAAHPDLASLRRVGTSRLGEPISMLSIGSGTRNALFFACAHPDEPIGAMTISHLAELLCRDDDLRETGDFTWHLIPCVNPDEVRLNEGWFQPPFSMGDFAARCYRPPSDRDLEWSFPFFHETSYFDSTLRETQMLMRVIDDLQPVVMGSLHNNVFGGVYFYISGEDAALQETLHRMPAAEGLPLRLGEPETPYIRELSPGVLLFPDPKDRYAYEVAAGADPETLSLAGSSLTYASRYGTRGIIVEVAYFDDPRVADQTPMDRSVRAVIADSTRIAEEGLAYLEPALEAVGARLRTRSVFEESVRSNLGLERATIDAKSTWAESAPETLAAATVADLFANRQEVKIRRLINLGTFIRMLETEVIAGHGNPVVRQTLEDARVRFQAWEDDLESELEVRVVPIRKLVAVQLGAVLAATFAAPRD